MHFILTESNSNRLGGNTRDWLLYLSYREITCCCWVFVIDTIYSFRSQADKDNPGDLGTNYTAVVPNGCRRPESFLRTHTQ